MRICIPTETDDGNDAQVNAHFGSAPVFTIYDTDSRKLHSVKNSEHVAQFQQLKEHMKSSIELLPSKERKLIKMYYFQNRTLEEAGAELGLSKSWTSRLHARALDMLFKKVNARIHSAQAQATEEDEEEVVAQQGGQV